MAAIHCARARILQERHIRARLIDRKELVKIEEGADNTDQLDGAHTAIEGCGTCLPRIAWRWQWGTGEGAPTRCCEIGQRRGDASRVDGLAAHAYQAQGTIATDHALAAVSATASP